MDPVQWCHPFVTWDHKIKLKKLHPCPRGQQVVCYFASIFSLFHSPLSLSLPPFPSTLSIGQDFHGINFAIPTDCHYFPRCRMRICFFPSLFLLFLSIFFLSLFLSLFFEINPSLFLLEYLLRRGLREDGQVF